MNHTPGPWVIDLRAQESPLIRGGEDYVDDVPQAVVAEVYPEDGDDGGAVTLANAHLLAAAPEMYEVLSGVLKMLTDTGWTQHHVMTRDLMLAALAKAEGRAK